MNCINTLAKVLFLFLCVLPMASLAAIGDIGVDTSKPVIEVFYADNTTLTFGQRSTITLGFSEKIAFNGVISSLISSSKVGAIFELDTNQDNTNFSVIYTPPPNSAGNDLLVVSGFSDLAGNEGQEKTLALDYDTGVIEISTNEGMTDVLYRFDLEPGDTVVLDTDDGNWFVVDAQTGELRFNMAMDFEAPFDVSTVNSIEYNNVYDVNALVAHGDFGPITLTNFLITVLDVEPEIINDYSLRDILLDENVKAVITVTTTASTVLRVFKITGADAALFSIDSVGQVTFNSAANFENPTDSDKDNVYHFTAAVTNDNWLTESRADFTVTISDVNDLPVFTSTPIITGKVNQLYQYHVTATDQDQADDLYIAPGLSPEMMAIDWLIHDPLTGILSGIPPAPGEYQIEMYAGDSVDPDPTEQRFTLTITDVLKIIDNPIATYQNTTDMSDVNLTADSLFSHAISLGGDYTAIGAPEAGLLNNGSVFIFKRGANGKFESKPIAELTPPSDTYSNFGIAVAMNGDILAIGTSPCPIGCRGEVLIYQKNDDGEFVYNYRTIVGSGAINEMFGSALAISKDHLIIGAQGEGKIYIYDITDGRVAYTSNLVESHLTANFGSSLAISGNNVVVGSAQAVHWLQLGDNQTVINTVIDSLYVQSNNPIVAIDQHYIVVGDPKFFPSDPNLYYFGKVDVLKINDAESSISTVATIIGSSTYTEFGSAVAIGGGTVLVGNKGFVLTDGSGNDSFIGAVDVYRNHGDDVFTKITTLLSNNGQKDALYGGTLAVDQQTMIIGAVYGDASNGETPFAEFLSNTFYRSILETTASDLIDIDTNSPAEQPVTFTVSGIDASLFTINENTGILRFITPPDYETPKDTDADNKYQLVVKADNNSEITSANITINVTDIYFAITNKEFDFSLSENDLFSPLIITSSTATLELSGLNANLFTLDSDGNVTFISAPDYQSNGQNTYQFTVKAANGTGETISADFSVTIWDATVLPFQSAAVTSAFIGEPYTYKYRAASPFSKNVSDDHNVTVTVTPEAAWLTVQHDYFNYPDTSGSGEFKGIPSVKGSYGVAINSTPSQGSVSEQQFTLKVDHPLKIIDHPAAIYQNATVMSDINLTAASSFAQSTSLSGDYAAVGAPEEGANGKVFIFKKDPNGQFESQPVDELMIPLPMTNFGNSVAINGDYLAISANTCDSGCPGVILLYQKNTEGRFVYSEKVISGTGLFSEMFGSTLALSDDYLIVGAQGVFDDQGSSGGTGKVYVYTINNGDIATQPSEIYAPNDPFNSYPQGDHFGSSLALSGDMLVISSSQYVHYMRLNKIQGALGAVRSKIGTNNEWPVVAIDDQYIVVGKPDIVVSGPDGDLYGQVAILKLVETDIYFYASPVLYINGPSQETQFGSTVAIAGNTILIGESGNITNSGMVHVYLNHAVDGFNKIKTLQESSQESLTHVNSLAVDHNSMMVGWDPQSAGASAVEFFSNSFYRSVVENTVLDLFDIDTDATVDDPVIFSVSGIDASLFVIDEITGVLRFIAPPDYDAPGDSGADNHYQLVVTAQNNFDRVSANVTINVTDINFSISNQILGFSLNDGENFYLEIEVTNSAILEIEGPNADLFNISRDGLVEFKSLPSYQSNGNNSYQFTVKATLAIPGGGGGETTSANFNISINLAAPIILNPDLIELDNGRWLTAKDPQTNDSFGSSISVQDDYVAVGVQHRNNYQGAVDLYHRDSRGLLTRQQSLTFPEGKGSSYGAEVILSGEYLAVVAQIFTLDLGSPAYEGAGVVFIYKQGSDGQFYYQQTINGAKDDSSQFGAAIAMSDGFLMISEPGVTTATTKGQVYIYQLDGTGLFDNTPQIITTPTIDIVKTFGLSIAMVDDLAVISSGYKPSSENYGELKITGQIYILIRDNAGEYHQVQQISSPEINDQFGHAVAISQDYLLVSATGSNNNTGAVYAYHKGNQGRFVNRKSLSVNTLSEGSAFGNTLAIDGQKIYVGTINANEFNGAVHIFEQSLIGNYSDGKSLLPLQTLSNSQFASAMTVSANNIFIGASGASRVDYYTNNFSLTIDEGSVNQLFDFESDIDKYAYKNAIYSLSGEDHTLFNIDQNSGVLTFKQAPDFELPKDFEQDNIYYLSVIAANAAGNTKAYVKVTVTDINDAPRFTKAPVVIAVEDSAYSYLIAVTDDDNDPVILSLNSQYDWLTLAGTTLYGTPSAPGKYMVELTAVDGKGGSTSQSFTIVVFNTNDAPKITSTPEVTVAEDSTYSYSIAVTDDDNDPVTLSLNSQYDWLTLTGTTLSGTPSVPGKYMVELTAVDGKGGNTSQSFTIVVSNTNDAPKITSTPEVTVAEDSTYSYLIAVTDDDNDPVILSLNNTYDWLTLTGTTLSGTPTVPGSYQVELTAIDGQGGVTLQSFNIVVIKVNQSPSAQAQSVQIIGPTATDILLTAEDRDKDPLTFTIISKPVNGVLSGNAPDVIYTPNKLFIGSDQFSFRVNDGQLDSNVALISIEVLVPYLAPKAIDDQFTRDNWQTFSLDVLANDLINAGTTVKIVNVTTDKGTVAIKDDLLVYQPQQGLIGTVTLTYSIADDYNRVSSAQVEVTIDNGQGPEISLPQDLCGDLEVNATGLYTRIDLGEASAVDRFGNVLPVSLVNGNTLYSPGLNQASWQATDKDGLTTIEQQNVCVVPLITIEKNQSAQISETVEITVYLNGESPTYPVIIPYQISGSLNADAHDLTPGYIEIASGTQASVNFNFLVNQQDNINDTVIITLDNQLNLGNHYQHTVTMTDQNQKPVVRATITQASRQRFMVSQADGIVTIKANLIRSYHQDIYYQWQHPLLSLYNISDVANQFAFDPSDVELGHYSMALSVSDSSGQVLDVISVFLEVVSQLAPLTDIDSDGDLIPDYLEGYQDIDGDLIPDYMDRISQCNVLQQQLNQLDLYLIEGEPGVCLNRGFHTLGAKSGGAMITQIDIEVNPDDTLVVDQQALNIGGVFDFVVTGLPHNGSEYAIVIPQIRPVPVNARYRKLTPQQGWVDFVLDDNNHYWSTAGEPGYCPPPNPLTSADNVWEKGLHAGDWCVQLVIQDGGPNDDDGIANSTIVDPGGVAVAQTGNHLPIAVTDQLEVNFSHNSLIVIDPLANDTDEDGDSLELTSAMANIGQVSIVEQVLHYKPASNYSGVVVIYYGIRDGQGGTALGTVEIKQLANTAPKAVGDNISTDNKHSVTINVLANDRDAQNDVLTVVSASVAVGKIVLMNNQVIYTPEHDFVGTVIIDYQIVDTQGASAVAQVVVTVFSAKEVAIITNKSGGSSQMLVAWLLLIMLFKSMIKSQGARRASR